MTDFTPERIAQLREILAKATPLPWRVPEHNGSAVYSGPTLVAITYPCSDGEDGAEPGSSTKESDANARLIAAINTLPAALDEIKRLSAKTRELADNDGCCAGCGSTMSMADLRKMGAVACCHERKMVSAKAWREKAIASEAQLSRVTAERDEAVGLTQELYEDFAPPPSPGCSCHISPPCNDCVEHSYTRELLENARAFLARMEGRRDG